MQVLMNYFNLEQCIFLRLAPSLLCTGVIFILGLCMAALFAVTLYLFICRRYLFREQMYVVAEIWMIFFFCARLFEELWKNELRDCFRYVRSVFHFS